MGVALPTKASRPRRRLGHAGEDTLGYVIAAYAVVIGTLLVYGLRIQARRRALLRRAASDRAPAGFDGESR